MTPPTKVKLIGGSFQDAEGALLANGYLELLLNQDENVSGVGQIVSGITIKILLDAVGSVFGTSSLTLTAVATSVNGLAVYTGTIPLGNFVGLTFVVAGFTTSANNGTFICTASTATTLTLSNANASAQTHSATATASQAVWGNDQMSPGNSYYRVTGFSALGQPVFGPNNQQITGNGGTFDVGTWVPNQVISWNPPLQPIVLQTNEINNGSQSELDLHAGANITLVDNGVGRVTIAATVPGGVTLETNGTPNGSQTLLNLKQGASITITDDGVGGVTIASTATTPGMSVAGQGYIFGPGFPQLLGSLLRPDGTLVVNANEIYITQFFLPFSMTIRKLAYYINGLGLGSHFSFGIYSVDGSQLLVDSGPITDTPTGAVKVVTLPSPGVLAPGVYWFAQTDALATTSGTCLTGMGGTSISELLDNSIYLAWGLVTDVSIAGQLPATITPSSITRNLGTLPTGFAMPK